ncbi:MAG TPA: hypothetical protein VHO06_17600 [Polyangia bacterium]|nr:hypothetical protein [Polyangia bacterium]
MTIKLRVSVLGGLLLAAVGCATTQHGARYTDAEVEMAMRRTENQTLERLATSNNTDIADAANSLARERAQQ